MKVKDLILYHLYKSNNEGDFQLYTSDVFMFLGMNNPNRKDQDTGRGLILMKTLFVNFISLDMIHL